MATRKSATTSRSSNARDNSQTPERDEDGRFTAEESPSTSRASGRNSRNNSSRDDHENDRSMGRFSESDDNHHDRSSSRGQGRNDQSRDDEGRFISEDERYSRSRGQDDYDNRSQNYNHGRQNYESDRYYGNDRYSRSDEGQGRGWHGDSRGHAEAGSHSWDNRREPSNNNRSDYNNDDRYGRSNYRNDQDGYNRSRSDSRDDNRSGGDGRGWHGDSRGHAEAGSHSWDNRRR